MENQKLLFASIKVLKGKNWELKSQKASNVLPKRNGKKPSRTFILGKEIIEIAINLISKIEEC